jgi:hypothetical protein
MVTRRDEHNDSVLMLNRDLFLLHTSAFKEAKSVFEVDARIWCAQEIKSVTLTLFFIFNIKEENKNFIFNVK